MSKSIQWTMIILLIGFLSWIAVDAFPNPIVLLARWLFFTVTCILAIVNWSYTGRSKSDKHAYNCLAGLSVWVIVAPTLYRIFFTAVYSLLDK